MSLRVYAYNVSWKYFCGSYNSLNLTLREIKMVNIDTSFSMTSFDHE